VLALALILHRYDLTAENDYQLTTSESITLKPRGFRLGLNKRAASSRLGAVDTQLTRLSA
jgi:cytochrome P450/NADPH-cytochrome P450 reductase